MAVYRGTTGADTFIAPTSEDHVIFGLAGNDTLFGGGGNDTILGGIGNDVVSGGAGNDVFQVSLAEGTDVYDGGIGFDRVVALRDNVIIGVQSFTGIEEFNGGGFANVILRAGTQPVFWDFSSIALIDIAQIQGSTGADRIVGTANADVINGGAGNDTLLGAGGDDTFLLSNGGGADRIDGGTGYDIIQATADNTVMTPRSFANIEEISAGGFSNVSLGVALGTSANWDFTNITLTDIFAIRGGALDDIIRGSIGDDNISGSGGNDRLSGGDGNDTLDGGPGANVLLGGAGDDLFLTSNKSDSSVNLTIFNGGTEYDVVSANADDTIILVGTGTLLGIEEINSGGFSNVTIGGTSGADVINLGTVIINDFDIAAINANEGDDSVNGTAFADAINGGQGDDTLIGNVGADTIDGGTGNDRIDGGNDDDELHGGVGDDTILGGQGADLLFGDDGFDTFIVAGNAGYDIIDGGAGFDRIVAAANNTAMQIGTVTNVEQISADGKTGVSILAQTGGTLDLSAVELVGITRIAASPGGATIIGSNGDDFLFGSTSADALSGGIGRDTITGGLGLDTLTGGAGLDLFRDNIPGITGDRITDFGVGDVLNITNLTRPASVTFAWNQATNTLAIDPDGAGILKAFNVILDGSFNVAGFRAITDGATGALITYDPALII